MLYRGTFFTLERLDSPARTTILIHSSGGVWGRGGSGLWDYIWGNRRSLCCRRVFAGARQEAGKEEKVAGTENICSDGFGTVRALLA